jgi:ribosomal protein L19E
MNQSQMLISVSIKKRILLLVLLLVLANAKSLIVSYQPPPNKRNLRWEENFRRLDEYCSIHGNSDIPQKYSENPALGMWVRRQRVAFKNIDMNRLETCNDLTRHRIERLRSVSFVFDKTALIWKQRLDELHDFKKYYGHTRVPAPRKGKKDKWDDLSIWVRNQRAMYNRLKSEKNENNTHTYNFLTEERMNALNAIEFCWDAQEQNWMEQYEKLVVFRKQHGHADVPSRFKDDPTLSRWVEQQRFLYRSYRQCHDDTGSNRMTPDRIQLLDDLAFRWDNKKDLQWWNNYKALAAYHEKYGTSSLSSDLADVKLRNWVINTRYQCKEYISSVTKEQLLRGEVCIPGLNQERIDALKKIDFCWLPSIESDGNMTAMPQEVKKKVLRKKLKKLQAAVVAKSVEVETEVKIIPTQIREKKAIDPFPWDEI